ncbi:hypothetical protein ACFQUU_07410 [Herbaspirillum sp. GCM10030257]|uniref:hypothetical protein n=1 Tax=Herbaspirillum sp. GCM10030257 TaxID=3273393 RepID=UPI003606A1EC
MKILPFIIPALALSSSFAIAQIPPTTPTTPTTPSTQELFIPLFGSTGSNSSAGGTANASTWFIDVTNRQVVFCSQSAGGTGTPSGTQTFTCTTQPIPAATTTPGTPPGTPPAAPAAGAPPFGTPASGTGGTS